METSQLIVAPEAIELLLLAIGWLKIIGASLIYLVISDMWKHVHRMFTSALSGQ